MNLSQVREIRFLSGLLVKPSQRTKGKWCIEHPSWLVGGGPSWASMAEFDTIEQAIEVAEELDPILENLFQLKLEASRVRQNFYTEAMRLAP